MPPTAEADRPFAFSPGGQTIFLTGVADVSRFVELISDRFPERARPRHLKALAQAGLLATTRRPRLISDIDEDEARKLVKDLHAIGVTTETRARPSLKKRFVTSVVVGFIFAFLFSPFVSAPIMVFLWANMAVASMLFRELVQARTQGGLLASQRSEIAVATDRTQWLAAAGATATVAYLFFAYQFAYADDFGRTFWQTFGPSGFMGTIAAVAGAVGIIATKTWGGRPIGPHLSAGPTLWERLFVQSKADRLGRSKSSAGVMAGLVFAFGAFFLVPFEVALLQAFMQQGPAIAGPLRSGPNPTASQRQQPRGRLPQARDMVPRQRRPSATAWWGVWPPGVFPMGVGFTMLLGFAIVLRRKLLLSDEANAVLASADHDRLIRAARRIPPVDRRRTRSLPATTDDGFVGSALRHATDLETGLSTEEAIQMWGLIKRLATGAAENRREQRSLEARCILESDRDQHLRFEFLRLAGEFETRAARKWMKDSLETTRKDDP